MRKTVVYLSLISVLFSCQPYGQVPIRSCNESGPVLDRRMEDLKTLAQNPDLLAIYNQLVKAKPSKGEAYAEALKRLVELLHDGRVFNSRADIEQASPLLKQGEHSIKTEADYMSLLGVLQTLSAKEDAAILIDQAASLYMRSLFTPQPTVGDCCTPECKKALEKWLSENE